MLPLTKEQEAALGLELAAKRQEHADLDAAIRTLTASGLADQMLIQRLKKRKLALKDRIVQLGRTWGTALFLFVVARPLSVLLGLAGTGLATRVKLFIGWFGVRGIGSLYYLMYAMNHGLPGALARDLIDITVVVVALSIIVHGVSVKPLMDKFTKGRRGSRGGS